MNDKEKRIREILEKMPRDKKLEFTIDVLDKMIMSVMKDVFGHLDRTVVLKSIEEAGRRAGENFAKQIIERYGIKVEDAPSAMQIMNIASFFDETPYKILKSTGREVVKRIEEKDFTPYAKTISKDVTTAFSLFLKSYYYGAVNVAGERFRIDIKDCAVEGKDYCTIILKDPYGSEMEKTVDIPKKVKEMSREERLKEKRIYRAAIIAHLTIILNDLLGFDMASKIVRDSVYPIGLESGKNIKEKFGLGENPEDVYLVHFISPYMMDIENKDVQISEETIIYKHPICPFGSIASIVLDYLNIIDARKRADTKFVICEACKGYASGLTHAISKEWETYSPKRLSAGDPYCLFLLNRGGGGKISLKDYG